MSAAASSEVARVLAECRKPRKQNHRTEVMYPFLAGRLKEVQADADADAEAGRSAHLTSEAAAAAMARALVLHDGMEAETQAVGGTIQAGERAVTSQLEALHPSGRILPQHPGSHLRRAQAPG